MAGGQPVVGPSGSSPGQLAPMVRPCHRSLMTSAPPIRVASVALRAQIGPPLSSDSAQVSMASNTTTPAHALGGLQPALQALAVGEHVEERGRPANAQLPGVGPAEQTAAFGVALLDGGHLQAVPLQGLKTSILALSSCQSVVGGVAGAVGSCRLWFRRWSLSRPAPPLGVDTATAAHGQQAGQLCCSHPLHDHLPWRMLYEGRQDLLPAFGRTS